MSGLLERLARVLRVAPPEDPTLEARVACFREVLRANNSALGALAEIQSALAGERRVSSADVQRLLAAATVQTYRMITNLNRMSSDRYRGLERRFNDLRGRIARRAEVTPYLGSAGNVIGLADAGAAMAEVIGQKSAFLAEARRILSGHVPDGFAISVHAYRALMASGGLERPVADLIAALDGDDVASTFDTAARITQMIENTPLPVALARELRAAVERLRLGAGARLAVRSSALQEGGQEVSFAGQYRSLLNVDPDGVGEAFRQVVASKYSPQAITYRLGRGFDDDEVAMCCCVIRMVDATAAGVLYSAFCADEGVRTLLQAVRGLGLSAVDGSAAPETLLVDRTSRRVVGRRQGFQVDVLRCAAGEGTVRQELPPESREEPVLSDGQAVAVASLAWRLEEALGGPVDVEWAIDREGQAWVLQVRPQPVHAEGAPIARAGRVDGAHVLLEAGSRAARGCGCGVVHRIDGDLDIISCPPGSVVVARDASPRLAVVLPRAAALVTDMGEMTGHLATVARELRVPALMATRAATEKLPAGEVVTVDADAGVVYRGRVDEALSRDGGVPAAAQRDPNRERLMAVADLVVPLTSRDRLASGYSVHRCRTLHDFIRFCHQATVEGMFDLGDRTLRRGTSVRRLVSEVPIDCRLFDLGGGLREGVAEGEVTIEDVTCRPLRALWSGMTDERLAWRKTHPVSMRGLMSAMVNYNFDQDQRVRAMGEPSYAFISDSYVNLNSRIGYHFSTFDAKVGTLVESNYASFRFVGGSTSIEQRSRRALLIERLLAAHGFETDCRADLVNARLRHLPAAAMEEALRVVGLVSGFVNHLDMSLTSDGLVEAYEGEFLRGNYGFTGGDHD
jgi:pyruvate,water dikinase